MGNRDLRQAFVTGVISIALFAAWVCLVAVLANETNKGEHECIKRTSETYCRTVAP